jgi:predicted GNAT family acetyltransferase
MDQFREMGCQEVSRLGLNDLDKIAALFDDHSDRPDAFTHEQLDLGIFYGAKEGEDLISISGTHIISEWASVAAIGNVFTHPNHRGKGWATKASAAVVSELIALGIHTIVLNVDMNNQPGLSCYRKLGFWPHYGYYEGVMEIWSGQHHSLWRVQ